MTAESEHQPVLARKLALGRERAEEKPRSILRALRLGLARAAFDSARLPLAVIGARQSFHGQEDLSEVMANGLLYLLFSSATGQTAAACVDAGFVSAIIQQLTTGEVSGGDVSSRKYTVTDAAMTAPLIETALAHAEELVEADEDRRCLADLGYVGHAEDKGALLLALEQERFRVCDLTVECSGGKRQGRLSLILPEPEILAPAAETGPGFIRRLDQASGVMRAELRAEIGELRLTLSQLGSIKVGDLLTLAGGRLDKTVLKTIERQKVAVGRLGQSGGMRAVRINETLPDPEVAPASREAFVEHEPRQPQAANDLAESPLATEHTGADSELPNPPPADIHPPTGVDFPSSKVE